MAELTGIFGVLALICAVIDLIHSPHNGDAHRMLIHIPEFIFFFGFLCLLEIWTFKTIIRQVNANRWLVVTVFAFFSGLLGLIFFGLAGGSFHGDGGPYCTQLPIALRNRRNRLTDQPHRFCRSSHIE
jgi:hypothetical protein